MAYSYILVASHDSNSKECARALAEVAAYSLHLLSRAHFGCDVDVHVGWAIIEADNDTQARLSLPPSMREKAQVVRVKRYSPDEIAHIRSFHKI